MPISGGAGGVDRKPLSGDRGDPRAIAKESTAVLQRLISAYGKLRIRAYRRRGLQIADDCRLIEIPNFGSEPYLISIGRHVTISARVSFINHDGGTWVFRDQPRFRNVIKYGRIVVHDNCFIGFGATILPGVSIGPNAVVAAQSVVTADVPANTVVGGVPARVLMSLEQYAESALQGTPAYDVDAYRRDKMAELLRLFPPP
jgi:acetyltransferase-like isoleucine patch superfamily enzyme